MIKRNMRKKTGGLVFPEAELKVLAETYAGYETYVDRSLPQDIRPLRSDSYIEKLIDDYKSGDAAATRELAEIFWDWSDATDYYKEIDAVLSEVGDQTKNRDIREMLHRLYLMAFRSFGRAPIESPSARSYVLAPQRAAASEGGKKSGLTRLQNAEKGWRATATKSAKAIRARNPELSQANLAEEIRAFWKGENIPGTQQLVKLISGLEKRGELQTMQRKQAAKALRHTM